MYVSRWIAPFLIPCILMAQQAVVSDPILVEQLKRIVFISDPNDLKRPYGTLEKDEGVSFLDIEPPSKASLINAMREYIGCPITIGQLDAIRSEVVEFYKARGYPVISVSVPSGQDIANGEIRVLVLVGKVGEVRGEGAKFFSNDWIAAQVGLKSGEPIQTRTLMGDLAWINNNPYRTTDIVFEKGNSLSETNVVLVTTDIRPFRLYGGYENNGYIIGGASRVFGGMNAANLWRIGHQFNYQFTSSTDFDEWYGMSGSYIAPLPWAHHTFKAFAAFIETLKPHLVDPSMPSPMHQSGKSWQLSGRYLTPLPPTNFYRHTIAVGFDFKRTNNFLQFSEDLVFDNYFDVAQFVVSYDGTLEDPLGSTLWEAAAYLSPGKLTRFDRTSDYMLVRPGAAANFAYMRASLDRLTLLPARFSWSMSSVFQWSSGKLIPSEEFSLGGFLTVRGYDENEVISDRGILIKNELRSPALHLFQKGVVKDDLQFLAFADVGYALQVDKNILDKNNTLLASFGPGVRYTINPYLSFRLDYGIQLKNITGRPNVGHDHSRIHLSLTAGFDPFGVVK